MSIDQAKKLDHFVCAECSEYDTKKSQEAVSASPLTNVKVRVLIICFHLFKVACVLSLWPFAVWRSMIYITSQDIVTNFVCNIWSNTLTKQIRDCFLQRMLATNVCLENNEIGQCNFNMIEYQ